MTAKQWNPQRAKRVSLQGCFQEFQRNHFDSTASKTEKMY